MTEHQFNTSLAKEYGIEIAIFVKYFDFWLEKNASNEKSLYEERYWTYNSVKAFSKQFEYLTENQIRRTLEKMVSLNILIVGNFNANLYDRTKWYSFSDEFIENHKSILRFSQFHLANLPNPFAEIAKPIPVNIPIKEPVNNNNISFSEICNKIFEHWNRQNIIIHSKLTNDHKSQIKTILKTYSIDEIIISITNYSAAYHSEYEYCSYKKSLYEFLKQKNLMPEFMNDGSKWINYSTWKSKHRKTEKSHLKNRISTDELSDYANR